MDEFKILLKAVLDSKSIDQSDVGKIQKVIEKYHLNLTADLDKASILAEIKKIVPELEAELKKITGVDIKINDKELIKAFDQVEKSTAKAAKEVEKSTAKAAKEVEKSIAKAAKEEEKLIDTMERVRAKSEQIRQAEEKRQQAAQARQQNKVLEEEYALRQKIASKASEIQLSIENGDFETQILGYETSLKKLGLSSEEITQNMKGVTSAYNELISSAQGTNIIPDNVVEKATMLNTEMSKLSNINKQLKLKDSLNADQLQVDQTVVRLNEQLRKNTAYSKEAKQQIKAWIDELEKGNVAEARLKAINSEAKQLHSSMASLNKIGFSWFDKLKNAWAKFGGWSFATGTLMAAVHKTTEAFKELKEVDTILTEISKTSERSQKSLENLGKSSVNSASKYGASISGYLKGVQEMSRAGFNNNQAEQLADLSVLAQSAGDMNADLANDYLIASDAAYGYSGNVQKLTGLLDGQNQVTNRNAVSMEELANATRVAANQLSNMGIEENELTALLGTGIATSREAGETVGRAVKGIMMNLQQVKGETGFDGEVIDEDSLKKVEARCHSVGVELEYMQDGIARLRDPMEVLKELAEVYNSLPDNSADKAGIISDIGGKYRGNVLSSILSNWNKYEKMLSDYKNAEGSALEEAIKTANSWEGLLNQISNNWTGFIQNFAEDGLVTNTLKFINELVKGLDSLAEKGLMLPTLLGGAGIASFIQNFDWPLEGC